MRVPTIDQLQDSFAAKPYPWPLATHVVVLRKAPGTLDAFDDMLLVCDSLNVLMACRCTADPGKPALENPRRKDGTAVILAGQHLDAFMFGKHHGDYDCLVPSRSIPVLRYTSPTDTVGDPSWSSSTQVHRANAAKESTVVGPWSEGCIVVANPNDFAKLMGYCRRSGQPRFTLTLLEWTA